MVDTFLYVEHSRGSCASGRHPPCYGRSKLRRSVPSWLGLVSNNRRAVSDSHVYVLAVALPRGVLSLNITARFSIGVEGDSVVSKTTKLASSGPGDQPFEG